MRHKELHLFQPPPSSIGSDTNLRRERRSGGLHFLAILEPLELETSEALAGIQEHMREFGPNSGPKFHTPPNAGIRVQILQYPILGPILYIQT
jgi:hypothetical protein